MDSAATAKYTNVDDIIIDTMVTAMRDSWMNPSSLYAVNVKDKINKCRANIASFINAKTEEIYFCSGASEANNWAIRGWVDNMLVSQSDMIHVISTLIEHKSTLKSLENDALGAIVHYCGVDNYGFVNYKLLEKLLNRYKNKPILVSVNMANNEVGTIQNIKMISELVHKHSGILHVDSTQAFGHIPIDVEELGVDMLSASGHKISPVLRGIGFLYKKNGINIQPLIYGAQENGMRGSTENTYGIIGLSKALEYCDVSASAIEALTRKRDYFIEYLKFKFGCRLNGHPIDRLPNNVNVILPDGVTGESVLLMLSMSNIFISTTSACNSHSITKSHVLEAIGLTDEEAMRSIRITISENTTYEEIDYFIDELDKVIKIIKG